MAPSSGNPGPPAKFPSTSDFNQVFNRINLSLSKHNSFLQTIRARHPQPAEPAATTTTTGAGFSSLASNSSSTTKSASSPSLIPHRKTQADLDAEEAQFAEHNADVAAAFGPGGGGSNAGIGYVPERKAIERARDDRDLRGRLLGKRAREQLDEAAAARKKRAARRGDSSDDEDEVGRSGLGRSKKKKTTMTMATSRQSQQLGEDDNEAGDVEQTATPVQVVPGRTVADDGSQERAVAKVTTAANQPNEVNNGSVGEEQVNMSGDGGKKKRKKKKKGKKGNDSET